MKRISILFAVSLWTVVESAHAILLPGAGPMPLTNANFDIDSTGFHWRNPVSPAIAGALFNDSRSLSAPNLLGLANTSTPQGRRQIIAWDHSGEQIGDETALLNTWWQYEPNFVYGFGIHAFSSSDATFMLQFLAYPTKDAAASFPATVVTQQVFSAPSPTDSSGGAVLAPDGITYYRPFEMVLASSNFPSFVGQYMAVQILTTMSGDTGHITGFPNMDNAFAWYVPEPSAMVLLGLGGVLLLRRKSHDGW